MKNLLLLILISVSLISCGPSAEERAAAEKVRQDSIATAMVNGTIEYKYQPDDIVWMKPDSIKAQILTICPYSDCYCKLYLVSYNDKTGVLHREKIGENMIFSTIASRTY
jgi:hypothetical protein